MTDWLRKSLSLLTAAMLVTGLAACGGENKQSDNGKGEAGQGEKVELRVGVMDSPGESENVEAVAKVFMEKNKNVTVKVEPIIGDFRAKILAQAASGDLPDVVWLADAWVREFANAGVLASLDGYMDESGVDRNDINQAMLGLGKVDDKQYMLPRDYNHMVTFVNKTMLEQEGLSVPENGWSWDDFMKNYAEKLTKKDGAGKTTQFALDALSIWPPIWSAFALGHGGEYANISNKKLTFSDEKVTAGLKDLYDGIKSGYITDPNGQYPENMFNAGKAAFRFGVKPTTAEINEAAKAKGFDWEVVTFPKLPSAHVVGGGTSGYGVFAKSKHLEEAGAFVSMFVTPEGQKAFGTTGNSVPVLKSLADDTTWRNNPVEGKNMDAFILYPEADVLSIIDTQLPIELIQDTNNGVVDAMNKYLLGKASLEDAMQSLDEKINSKWK
ncbi:extracellular solute-binding protein [Paenibacillus sp. GCM10027626]|uniref:ABC transporter substrate-binding protein n=1 Tax=Paenibacillus sp. GCM10027626 TaxID=3273411 RepID=UPI00363339AA